MALVPEDGTGLENSNTYAEYTDLTAYADLRGITTLPSTQSELEALLVRAMDYIESLYFIGDKLTEEQALQWPRENVEIDGFCIDEDVIPLLLKEAQMETAIAINDGYDPLAVRTRTVKREKVFYAVEVEYMDNSVAQDYAITISKKLQKLIRGSSNGIYFKAIRA